MIALAQTPSGLYLFDPNLGMFKASDRQNCNNA